MLSHHGLEALIKSWETQGDLVPLCQVSPAAPVWHGHWSPHGGGCTQRGSLCRARCLLPASNALHVYYLAPIPGTRLRHANPAVHEAGRTTASERLQMGPWEEVGTCLRARGLCLKKKNSDCRRGEESLRFSLMQLIGQDGACCGPGTPCTQTRVIQEPTRSKA